MGITKSHIETYRAKIDAVVKEMDDFINSDKVNPMDVETNIGLAFVDARTILVEAIDRLDEEL